MKCRLHLGKLSNSSYFGIEQDILCKKIHTIIISGKTYHKNDCGNDSMKIQNFYRMILKNIDNITYIKFGTFVGEHFTECTEYHIENRLLHNFAGPAVVKTSSNSNDLKAYYIEGNSYSENSWKTNVKRNIWLREHKLERIINDIL